MLCLSESDIADHHCREREREREGGRERERKREREGKEGKEE